MEIEKTKTIFIISVLKVVYVLVLVFSISNFFIIKNSQGRKFVREKKVLTTANLALFDRNVNPIPMKGDRLCPSNRVFLVVSIISVMSLAREQDPEFGRSLNPSPTEGAHYAHDINACPPGFEISEWHL